MIIESIHAPRLLALIAALAAVLAAFLYTSTTARAVAPFTVYNETQGDHPHWGLDQTTEFTDLQSFTQGAIVWADSATTLGR